MNVKPFDRLHSVVGTALMAEMPEGEVRDHFIALAVFRDIEAISMELWAAQPGPRETGLRAAAQDLFDMARPPSKGHPWYCVRPTEFEALRDTLLALTERQMEFKRSELRRAHAPFASDTAETGGEAERG